MIRGSRALLAALILLAGCSVASAQDATIGAGKVEIGGFPGGGTFFVGGDDNKEVNFNVYTAGGGVTYYFNNAVAIEGEFTGSVGWAQDVHFQQLHAHPQPDADRVELLGQHRVLPGRHGRQARAVLLTGGIGAIALSPRVPTKVFGYDVDTGRHADVHRRKHRRRHQDLPRGRCAELGLPRRLPLSVRQLRTRTHRRSSRNRRAAARTASTSGCCTPGRR